MESQLRRETPVAQDREESQAMVQILRAQQARVDHDSRSEAQASLPVSASRRKNQDASRNDRGRTSLRSQRPETLAEAKDTRTPDTNGRAWAYSDRWQALLGSAFGLQEDV